MKHFLVAIALISFCNLSAQKTLSGHAVFPDGTILYADLPYAGDTTKKHQLDIYLPAHHNKIMPLVVWVHGGAWLSNDKHADMGYMKNTIHALMDKGYALASINYRYSTDAVFPALVQDGNQALEYLYQHSATYGFDKNDFSLMGFSAGGHLASLLATSSNNHIADFYPPGMKPHFHIGHVVDFYGPADLVAMAAITSDTATGSPLALLLGAKPLDRPDLARRASPATYVDAGDPPFIIIQGEKDASVPQLQSKLFSAWLSSAKVRNEIFIVPGAPHYGEMFDTPEIQNRIFSFLQKRN